MQPGLALAYSTLMAKSGTLRLIPCALSKDVHDTHCSRALPCLLGNSPHAEEQELPFLHAAGYGAWSRKGVHCVHTI